MIIDDALEDTQSLHKPAREASNPSTSRTTLTGQDGFPPPPAYLDARHDVPYRDEAETPLLGGASKRKRADVRLARSLAVALMTLLLFAAVAYGGVGVARWSWWTRVNIGRERWMPKPGDDGILIQCPKQQTWTQMAIIADTDRPYRSESTITLPADAQEIFIGSNGPLVFGALKVMATEVSRSDQVTVYLRSSYAQRTALDNVDICRVDTSMQSGLGIYTLLDKPGGGSWDPQDQVQLDIVVEIPRLYEDSGPRQIRTFRTNLANYSQDVHVNGLRFGSLSITGTDRPVTAYHVDADNVVIKTFDATIKGTFNVSESLTLTTSDGAININATLRHLHDTLPTALAINTTDGAIFAGLELISAAGHRGQYTVNATTSYGDLVLTANELPINSTLRLHAHTTDASATVALPPTFEGNFTIHSDISVVPIPDGPTIRDFLADDPTGLGRRRYIPLRAHEGANRHTVDGSVYWGNPQGRRLDSYVTIDTLNAYAQLLLSP